MLVNATSIYAGDVIVPNKILVNGEVIENKDGRKMEVGGGTIKYFDDDRSLLLDGVNDTSVSIVMPEGAFIIRLRGENKISEISAHGN